MNGEYRVKNPDLLELYQEAKRLTRGFEKVTITHVRREQNKRADELGNEALDGRPYRRGEPPRPSRSIQARSEARRFRQQPSPIPRCARMRSPSSARRRRPGPRRGLAAVPVEAVWEQLWSVLEDGNVLAEEESEVTCPTSCSSTRSPTPMPRASAARG